MSDPRSHSRAHDHSLREEVQALGDVLGEVLRAERGREFSIQIERARLLSRDMRGGDSDTAGDLDEFLGALDPAGALDLIRTFSMYFGLVNLAERVRGSRRSARGSQVLAGSFDAVLTHLKKQGLTLEELPRELEGLLVEPILTAHPTEATRRTILKMEQRIARVLVGRPDASRVPLGEDRATLRRVREELAVAWQTEEHVTGAPTVMDEADRALFYVIHVVYGVIPAVHDSLRAAIKRVYGRVPEGILGAPVIRFGSWIGGDMDGNPNVGADTIRAAIRRHRELILERLAADAQSLAQRLTHSLTRVTVDHGILELVDAYKRLFPKEYGAIPARYHDMPYRVLLELVAARLRAAAGGAPGGYPGAPELLQDLRAIAASLRSNRGRFAGLSLVRGLIDRAATFGFHLAALDVRQDARVNREAVASLLGDAEFPKRPGEERARILSEALERVAASPAPEGAEQAARMLDVMRAIGECRRDFGPECVGLFIISMAQGADDVLAVLYLARRAGLVENGAVPLDIAPLFETVADLKGARATLEAILAQPSYRAHLSARGGVQPVMLGYSDSNKDSGICSSRWSLYRAQAEMVACCEAAGAGLTLFHGRGGTVSRGGGKPRDAILAEPAGALHGRLRLTEQGEIIHARYGLPGNAQRTLELMVGALLEKRVIDRREGERVPQTFYKVMAFVADESRTSYRETIHGNPMMYPYFRASTPIDVIERMRIGSRPPSRREQKGIDDLRAIPWVFAWTQSRQIVPGWFGAGFALGKAAEEYGLGVLQEMAANWRFFANLLSDMEMVLLKSDMEIARQYAALAPPEVRGAFDLIRDECARATEMICRIRKQSELLQGDDELKRSILLRNPYIDPISLLQVRLLRRWREGGREDPALERALFSTVKGIARGLQNTG